MSTSSNGPHYRGSPKHKNIPARGSKGTLCPDWTHENPAGSLGNDLFAHQWSNTKAATLFANAVIDPETGHRLATERGIAFEAKPTNDGTWHGYPVAWESIPDQIRRGWLADGKVSRRDIKRYLRFEKTDIHWALETDQ